MADGDLISRESLLAGIAELKESPWYKFGKADPNIIRHDTMEAMMHYGYLQRKETVEVIEKICIEKEPAVLADSGWISVKDRLPETSGRYLVHTSCIANHRPLKDNEFVAGFINRNWVFEGWEFNLVTYWRPLPEPPKEDKDETNQ